MVAGLGVREAPVAVLLTVVDELPGREELVREELTADPEVEVRLEVLVALVRIGP